MPCTPKYPQEMPGPPRGMTSWNTKRRWALSWGCQPGQTLLNPGRHRRAGPPAFMGQAPVITPRGPVPIFGVTETSGLCDPRWELFNHG